MIKRTKIIIIFIIIFGSLHAKHNFELKNNSKKTVYFSLGHKEYDPVNDGIKTIKPGSSFTAIVDMSKYPELLVSWFYPFPGSKVNIYELDHQSKAKQMLLQVNNASALEKNVEIVPQSNHFLSNNVVASDLKGSKMIYKPTKVSQDPYVFIGHFLENEFFAPKQNLNAQSSPFDLLGLRFYASQEEILKRYELLVKRVAYLQEHPDLKKLYKRVIDIWKNAYTAAYNAAGG